MFEKTYSVFKAGHRPNFQTIVTCFEVQVLIDSFLYCADHAIFYKTLARLQATTTKKRSEYRIIVNLDVQCMSFNLYMF